MDRRTLIRLAASSGAAIAAGATAGVRPSDAHPARVPGARRTVAADGSGDFTSIQAAVDAVPAGNTAPITIDIAPGTYRGQVIIPADKPHLLLRGRGACPEQVVITDDRANGTPRPDGGTWGTSMPQDPMQEDGRGLALATAVLDALDYDRTGEVNHWTMLRRRG